MSLHADALSGAQARGLSVYTLSESASDKASAALAERHNRADMLAGVFILADRPFAEKDRIQVEKPSGHWGGWGDVKSR